MRLRQVVLAVLVPVIGLFAAGMWVIQRGVVMPSFLQLEDDLAVRNLARVTGALNNEIGHLEQFTADWAAWDDTYAFVAEPNPQYIEANLSKALFEAGNFSAAYYIAPDGRVVWGGARDPEQDFAEVVLDGLHASVWPLDHALLLNRQIDRGTAGVMRSGPRTLLVAARPIITSKKEGPMRGWLVLAKQLSADLVGTLEAQVELQFELRSWSLEKGEDRDRAAMTALLAGAPSVLSRVDNERMYAYAEVRDILGQPALLARIELGREVSARGDAVLSFAFVSTLAASCLLLVLLVLLLGRFVVGPLARLTEHALAIGKEGGGMRRLHSQRRDEIGILSREFDAMVERLEESRRRLIEVARQGGRSEIATSVLHNVGNVLNSISVANNVLGTKIAGVDERTITRLLELLLAHQHDLGAFISNDLMGRQLPNFLRVFVQSVEQQLRQARSEHDRLGAGLEHLQALVAAQQQFAGVQGMAEPTDLKELVEQAVAIARANQLTQGVRIDTDLAEDLPLVQVQKHRVLEVLVNLVINAIEATLATGRADCRIVVGVRLDGANLELQVEDDGIGIAPDDLPKVFRFGFTTKPDGHGFGLHSSVNTMREMGGDLSAHSDGKGQGARFLIQLPIASSVASECAVGAPS